MFLAIGKVILENRVFAVILEKLDLAFVSMISYKVCPKFIVVAIELLCCT
jgi:hypothetical protein